MTSLDRLLQRWRGSKVGPYLSPHTRVLDIGCSDGALLRQFKGRYAEAVGIDPELKAAVTENGFTLLPGFFPEALASGQRRFNVISMLAVLEHVPEAQQHDLARNIASHLDPGGYLVITVPSPFVDRILDVLHALRLVHGMNMEQHYGFKPERTPVIFGRAGLVLIRRSRFQLGVNNLFVFQKPH